MANAFILTFDRNPDSSYVAFHNELVAFSEIKSWWHYIKSNYIIITDLKVNALSERIRKLFEKHGLNNVHLLISVNLDERQGMLPPDAWKWLKTHEDSGYS